MNILFICEGNINRSQMAEAYLKSMRPDIHVESAGTCVGPEREGKPTATISTKSIDLMHNYGIDMSNAIMKQVTEEMVERADKVIVVGPIEAGYIPPFVLNSPKLETWDILDPGYGLISHEKTRELVYARVYNLAHNVK